MNNLLHSIIELLELGINVIISTDYTIIIAHIHVFRIKKKIQEVYDL